MQSFFILGTQREIARAEIDAVVGTLTPFIDVEDVLAVEDFEGNLAAEHKKFGSVIKTGIIYASVPDQDTLIAAMADLVTVLRPGNEKVKFGLSVYHGGHRGRLTALRTQTERMGMQLKRAIQERGRSCRLVTSKVPVLSSVIVTKQKLLELGIEFCLFPTEKGIYIGVTESVQDFEEWSARDYGRPARDAKRGMLPPKLARAMLNLATTDTTNTVLDPFCGVGTVLTEASALGFTKLVGSDIDEKAAQATRENLAWELERSNIEVTAQIVQTPVEDLASFLAPASIDVAVTEVFLGKPRTGDEDRMELESRMVQLQELYTEAFRSLAAVLVPGGRVVIAIPAYAIGGSFVEAQVVDRASLLGFTLERFTGRETTRQGALRYGRSDQLVMRDIYRFVNKK